MSWAKRYVKITNATQLKVGDFISWFGTGFGRRYGIIDEINNKSVWANFNINREDALQKIADSGHRTNIEVNDLNDIRRE